MPFVKGESGNPAGRPKGSGGLTLIPIMRRYLEKIPEGQKNTYKELLIEKLFKKAMVEQDSKSLKIIINYIDGLPSQSLDLTTDGNPFTALMADLSEGVKKIANRE